MHHDKNPAAACAAETPDLDARAREIAAGRSPQRAHDCRPLPARLSASYDWIDSAGEWADALTDPDYARGAAANACEHDVLDVSADTIRDTIAWVRECTDLGRAVARVLAGEVGR